MAQSSPLVSVILTHHLDRNRPYLNLAMNGLARQVSIPIEVIVLSDSETVPEVPEFFTLVHDRDLTTATKKVELGIKMAHPESRYIFHHSDDVLLSKHTLYRMAATLGDSEAILNPMCNNDLASRYMAPLKLKGHMGERSMPIHADLSDMDGWTDAVTEYESPFHHLSIVQEWVTFAATMIPKKVYERVGPLDPALDSRHNDQDFCYRAARLNIPSMIHMGAFAFHFGSKTLGGQGTPEQDAATEHFRKKWG